MLRPGGVFAGRDSQWGPLSAIAHLGDTLLLVDPVGLPERLRAAGIRRGHYRSTAIGLPFSGRGLRLMILIPPAQVVRPASVPWSQHQHPAGLTNRPCRRCCSSCPRLSPAADPLLLDLHPAGAIWRTRVRLRLLWLDHADRKGCLRVQHAFVGSAGVHQACLTQNRKVLADGAGALS